MRRAFVTADVFTTTKGAGNPLAVVLDCAGLSDAQMQMIAREFNISETTFVLPPKALIGRLSSASSPRRGNCRSQAIP